MGLSAEFVGSAQDDPAATATVLNGTVQLVFISPENLLNNRKFRGKGHLSTKNDSIGGR